VYSEPPTTRDNIITRIIITFENIPSEILRSSRLIHRIHLCRRVHGQNLKHLRNSSTSQLTYVISQLTSHFFQ